jgi:GT2 family glycosyltransferase
MVEKSPSVDIIIVNYNGMAHLPSCLESVFRTDYPVFSVIVVDNASKDGSPEWVKENYPAVRLIQNEANLGFGKANMIGIQAGCSPLVALLNSDTKVTPGWLVSLVQGIQEDESIAAVCSKLLFMRNPRVLNSAGGGMNFVGYGYDMGIFEIDNGRFDQKKEVFFPCAAACLLKKSALQEVGGFDEHFFMYHEDVDLGWRFHLMGYSIRYVPTSIVYHAFGGTSIGSGGMAFRNRLGQRHALRSLLKNYELPTLSRALPVFLGVGLRHALVSRSFDFIQCIAWNVKKLPDTLRMRKRIQNSRKAGDRKLMPLIWQNVALPFRFPDYEACTPESFLRSRNRRASIEMAKKDSAALGYGWHASEADFRDPGICYRWSKEEAVFYLWNPFGDGVLEMEVLALSETLQSPRKIFVSVNGDGPHEFSLESDEWEIIRLAHTSEKGLLEIKLSAEKPWKPDEYFNNGDVRTLGIGVKAAAFLPAFSRGDSFNGISVIIPTYNRAEKLLKVLKALEVQSLDKAFFELIVVDDGSTDSTQESIETFSRTAAMKILSVRQSNKKQGAARNLGIKYAKMPLVCFIGDDIVPDPNFLKEHLAFHQMHNRDGYMVAIGRTKWPKDLRATPFMRFIGEYGHQFGYSLIKGKGPLGFNFFYTSNISMPKDLLTGLEYVFQEDFQTYGWEDIELGYRLEKMGMRLLYNADAVAYHDHATDILAFCKRQFNVGKASRTFLHEHPELDWFLGGQDDLEKLAKWGFLCSWTAAAGHLLDKLLLLPLPHAFYNAVLRVNYAKGSVSSE